MAASRAFPRCGTYFSRSLATLRATNSTFLSARVAIPQRYFTSGMRFMEAFAATPATEAELSRSISLLMLPKRATKSDIEGFLKPIGVDMRMQMRFDRFTFYNDTMCFVELANEQQAQDAAKRLNNTKLLEEKVVVLTPLKEGFFWTQGNRSDAGTSGTRYLQQNEENAAIAIKPLLEGRRLILSVQTPGWGDGKVSSRIKSSREVIEKYFGKYGIEAIGGFSPFYGDKKPDPRLLCLMDFETKEGADSAIEAFHDKDIEGCKVWLRVSKSSPWRANQFGRVSKEILAALQEKGVVSQEVHEDRFSRKKHHGKKTKSSGD